MLKKVDREKESKKKKKNIKEVKKFTCCEMTNREENNKR